MSKYTTEVRFICEKYAGLSESKGYTNVQEIINTSWDKIFDFDFPIFDAEYKPILCKKILKHYYTREIGFETVGLWKLKLDMMMNEIMPYYNKLYESELLEFDPFNDVDYQREHEGEDAGSGRDTGTHNGTVTDVGNVDVTNSTWDIYSDTPQGALTNVNNETYLTNARKITQGSQNDNDNTRTYNEATGATRNYSNTDEYLDHIFGKVGSKSYSKMLEEFRETFLNIDVDVINSLSDLFMKVW